MSHLGYILAAYLAATTILAVMIVWVAADLRIQRRKLAQLEPGENRRGTQ